MGNPDEHTLFEERSEVQEIVLSRHLADGALSLTLDGVWQFDSHDEHVFHETLCDAAMSLSPVVESVLVLGGGDGLALRNLLRYAEVKRAVLCEIDPAVIRMTRSVPEMVALSEGSLDDPRVEVVVADARDYVLHTRERHDVVICDFPACTGPALEPLFGASFYRDLARVTHPRSVVSVQVSQDPPGFWNVLRAVEAAFPWALPLLVELTREGSLDPGWADFVVASQEPREPVRALAPGLGFLSLEELPRLVVRNRTGPELVTDASATTPWPG